MRVVLVLFALCVVPSTGTAQVTVQQPVVSRFGVTTSVSVPDRGRAHLASVSRYAASRSRYGFGPAYGSSVGRSLSTSSLSVSVRVHDLNAMDAYLLSNDGRRSRLPAPALTARAMLNGGRDPSRPVRDERTVSPQPVALRAYERGRRAELEGRIAVARLHYEMAARHGSLPAKAKLGVLTARPE